jgi:hypothetical protein
MTRDLRPGRRYALVGLAIVSVLALAGCGDDKKVNADRVGPTSGPSATVTQTADADGDGDSLPVPERRFFTANSPWNTRVDGARIDENSDRMIARARERVGVIEREGNLPPKLERRVVRDGLFINTERWTTPVIAGGEPTSLICRQEVCGDGDETLVLNIPTDVDPDPRYDGWFSVFDTDGDVAYDFWRARRENDGSISYHFMRKWELDGKGYHEPYVVSARGSGLPLFAGLIRPGELESGRIEHALAISVPGPAQGSFVHPASSTDGNGRVTSLPEGARIRLKADVTLPVPRDPRTGKRIKMTPAQRRLADAIVSCLRTYGAIVVDRAAVPTLYAQRDVTAGLIRGNELQGLRLDDFEVIELGRRYDHPEHIEVDEEDGDDITPSPSATETEGANQ